MACAPKWGHYEKYRERERALYGNYFIQEHRTETITNTGKVIGSNLGSESRYHGSIF
jgi:hypothetical protein